MALHSVSKNSYTHFITSPSLRRSVQEDNSRGKNKSVQIGTQQ